DRPGVGVGRAGGRVDEVKERAGDSVEKSEQTIDPKIFDRFLALLRYIDGDYNDPATFRSLREVLGSARHPLHYLAIPPSMFEIVVEQLAKSRRANDARIVVEKPFGRDLPTAQELNRVLHSVFQESA